MEIPPNDRCSICNKYCLQKEINNNDPINI